MSRHGKGYAELKLLEWLLPSTHTHTHTHTHTRLNTQTSHQTRRALLLTNASPGAHGP